MKIFPVIHHADNELSLRNADLAFDHDCQGVFLISHLGHDNDVVEIAKLIKEKYPDRTIGINLLAHTFEQAAKKALFHELDAIWTDNPGITSDHIHYGVQNISERLYNAGILAFASVAFKYQLHESNPGQAAYNVRLMNMIPTTSGPGTGEAPSLDKIKNMKEGLGKDLPGLMWPLAVASGITPENAVDYKDLVTYALVATGISKDFHTLSEEKLKALIESV